MICSNNPSNFAVFDPGETVFPLHNKYAQTGAEQDSDGSQRRTPQQLTAQAQGTNIQPIRSTGALT